MKRLSWTLSRLRAWLLHNKVPYLLESTNPIDLTQAVQACSLKGFSFTRCHPLCTCLMCDYTSLSIGLLVHSGAFFRHSFLKTTLKRYLRRSPNSRPHIDVY
jgi:hypothetical protein